MPIIKILSLKYPKRIRNHNREFYISFFLFILKWFRHKPNVFIKLFRNNEEIATNYQTIGFGAIKIIRCVIKTRCVGDKYDKFKLRVGYSI